MKITKKSLSQILPGMTPSHLNIRPVQVDAIITALSAVLASQQPSRVLQFFEDEEKARRDKLGE